jgi:hypothetical protein
MGRRVLERQQAGVVISEARHLHREALARADAGGVVHVVRVVVERAVPGGQRHELERAIEELFGAHFGCSIASLAALASAAAMAARHMEQIGETLSQRFTMCMSFSAAAMW